MRSIFQKSLISLVLAFLTGACNLDQGLGPLETQISGKITFFATNLRPDNVGEVRVAALLNFPPSGLGDVVFSEPIDFLGDTISYDLFLPKGEYPAVVLLWKPRGENWSFNSLLGVYGFAPPLEFNLLPVSINEETPVITEVDMLALWNFAGSDGRMNGNITFQGTPPPDTEALLLVSLTQPPNFDNLLFSLLFLGGLPLPVSASQNPLSYQLKVFNGTHQFIGLFWKGVGTPLEELKLIGFYRDPAMQDQPGNVEMPENGTVNNIDFIADFNTLPDGIRP